ncbi:MAG TPA: hypothetical protein PKK11_00330 [Methanothrix sp.]|nr:hypothetical protein [Methanothrix sp.]HPT19429.1 hypothetical protein [Methanothrix sp.]
MESSRALSDESSDRKKDCAIGKARLPSAGGAAIMALPAAVASIIAVAIGLIFLIFALPSLGGRGAFDYFFSQGAGGLLIVLLGLCGGLGAALAAQSRRLGNALVAAFALSGLFTVAALALFGEWAACLAALIIILAAALGLAWQRGVPCLLRENDRGSTAAVFLLLFAGLLGFPLCQASITLLPYGWKAWSICGVLFLFSGLYFAAPAAFARLPLLSCAAECKGRRWIHLLYALLSLAAIIISVAALGHLPEQAGPLASASEAGNVALSPGEAFDPPQSGCGCKNSTTSARLFGGLSSILTNNSSGSNRSNNSNNNGNSSSIGRGRAEIVSPGDARTFPHGEAVLFQAGVFPASRSEPREYIWRSSRDGIIGRNESFSRGNLSLGWHNITLTMDVISANSSRIAASSSSTAYVQIGIAAPWVCGNVNPRPRYYPLDTPCRDIWPNGSAECQEVEVCHPDLDWIVNEAVDCCDGTARPGSACAKACAGASGDRKRCRGLYIINALGPDAVYMQGYALFKACCSGYPECSRMCLENLTGECVFREGYNQNVSGLACRSEESGIAAWRSDTNMSENSAVMGLFPAHATIDILQTGVCSDYSAALTTLLRKAGYSESEVFSTSSEGYDLPLVGHHPGHAYNLVWLPGESRYHVVDTTGNGAGINLVGLPGYFRFTGCFLGRPVQLRVLDWWIGYCSKLSSYGYNDAGYFHMPPQESICGCPEETGRLYD